MTYISYNPKAQALNERNALMRTARAHMRTREQMAFNHQVMLASLGMFVLVFVVFL